MLLLPDLSPHSLGALLALYEHRAFVLGSLWEHPSPTKWGVELGKRHAGEIRRRCGPPRKAPRRHSTAGLLARLRTPPAAT
ncbi:MAG: hypothetical protein R3E70_15730 [Burkholderiaceae bacterium]